MPLTFILNPDYKMDKNYLIQLTSRLYQLTLLFPKKDPLRYKMRELGTEILANSALIFGGKFHQSQNLILDAQKDIEVLNCFFEVVKTLNWVKESELLEIQREYSKIGEEVENFSGESEKQLKLNQIKEKEELENKTVEKEPLRGLQMAERRLPDVKDSPVSKNLLETKNSIINKLGTEKLFFKKPFLSRKNKILEILKEKEKAQVKDFKEFFPEVSKRTLRRDFRYLTNKGFIERKGEKNDTFYQLKEVGHE